MGSQIRWKTAILDFQRHQMISKSWSRLTKLNLEQDWGAIFSLRASFWSLPGPFWNHRISILDVWRHQITLKSCSRLRTLNLEQDRNSIFSPGFLLEPPGFLLEPPGLSFGFQEALKAGWRFLTAFWRYSGGLLMALDA